jgi:hypothetical protein
LRWWKWWRGVPQNADVASSRAETPALVAGDSSLGESPRQSSKSDSSDALPKLGRRLSVSGRRLWVGRRLRSPGVRDSGLSGLTRFAIWLEQFRDQAGVGPETSVSGRRLRPWSHLGWRLRPSRPETPALVVQQWLHFVEDYIKPSSTSRSGCGFHSLSSIVAKLQSTSSLSLANRTQSPFGI